MRLIIGMVAGVMLCAIFVIMFWKPLVNLYVLGNNAAQVTQALQNLNQRQEKVEEYIRNQQPTPVVVGAN